MKKIKKTFHPCKKSQYSNEKAANEHISIICRTSVRSRLPVRSYHCNKCGFWHITSKKSKLQRDYESLQVENVALKSQNQELLKAISLRDSKMDSDIEKSIAADERVKKLRQDLAEKGKIIANLRETISTLVSKLKI